MITGVVLVEHGAERLATTLGSLVPAVVEGVMGDAVVIVRRPDAAVASVAEVAGASIVTIGPGADPWRAGAALARREWLLCLADGDLPREGWMRAADQFLTIATRGGQPLGRFSRSCGLASAVLDFTERWTGARKVRAGDLVHRRWLETKNAPRARPIRIAAAIARDIS